MEYSGALSVSTKPSCSVAEVVSHSRVLKLLFIMPVYTVIVTELSNKRWKSTNGKFFNHKFSKASSKLAGEVLFHVLGI